MNKFFVSCAVLFLSSSVFLAAQDESLPNENLQDESTLDTDRFTEDDAPQTIEVSEPSKKNAPLFLQTRQADITTGLPRKKRFEIGFFAFEAGASNTWFSTNDIITRAFSFNTKFNAASFLDKGELLIESSIFSKPLFLRFRTGNNFIIEIATSVEESARFILSQTAMDSINKLLEWNRTNPSNINALVNELSGEVQVAGSAFAALSAGVEITPHKKIWIRAAPSIFVPLFYIPKTEVHLKGDISNGAALIGAGSKSANIWTISSDDIGVGFDLAVEMRYALWPILDIGANAENIPLVPAKMSNRGTLNFDTNFNVSSSGGNMSMKTSFESSQGNSIRMISRPTRLSAYTVIKPFSSHILLIKPDIGFSMGAIFAEQILNWGLETEINLPKILSISLGFKDFEYVWTNYIKLGIDFKYAALQLGAGLRGQNFVSSWNSKSLWAFIGLTFGI